MARSLTTTCLICLAGSAPKPSSAATTKHPIVKVVPRPKAQAAVAGPVVPVHKRPSEPAPSVDAAGASMKKAKADADGSSAAAHAITSPVSSAPVPVAAPAARIGGLVSYDSSSSSDDSGAC